MNVDLEAAQWRKSSYSGGSGGNCVEVAAGLPGVVAMRDSKDPDGAKLFFTRAEWDPETPQIAQGEMIHRVLTEAGKDHFFHVMATHNHMSQIYSVGTSEKQLTDLLGPGLKSHATVKAAAN